MDEQPVHIIEGNAGTEVTTKVVANPERLTLLTLG
jgi:hypothetical protein